MPSYFINDSSFFMRLGTLGPEKKKKKRTLTKVIDHFRIIFSGAVFLTETAGGIMLHIFRFINLRIVLYVPTVCSNCYYSL